MDGGFGMAEAEALAALDDSVAGRKHPPALRTTEPRPQALDAK